MEYFQCTERYSQLSNSYVVMPPECYKKCEYQIHCQVNWKYSNHIYSLNVTKTVNIRAIPKYTRNIQMYLRHPAETSVNSVIYDKPINSASYYGQWGHFLVACGHTIISVENRGPIGHLWTYSQNNQTCRQICILGYSTRCYFKLTLNRIK